MPKTNASFHSYFLRKVEAVYVGRFDEETLSFLSKLCGEEFPADISEPFICIRGIKDLVSKGQWVTMENGSPKVWTDADFRSVHQV